MKLSCGVYEACFAKYCSCSGENEYFLSYGKPYCEKFLATDDGWSDAGKKWRDATLLCLQEKIVPQLDISEDPQCDCKKMKEFAFQTHVDCYTQAQASVCDLEWTDYKKIYDTISVWNDLATDQYGRRQFKKVFAICAAKKYDKEKKEFIDKINELLK
ncbi:hypothetical protein CN311_16025 [Mesorhizobium sanjuanii]|uniref:Uncharacterized protein n=2 Tax=Mesorhizobium sanjuanii TaxID=2037900 RepID=A0A2A6FEQ2_9HYPH|nr:hypothetical protein CN311_16025 [Mesorhizobium sanjuanii]